ncbi:MAG: hypothetical protein P8Z30_17555, partial [Acidobacteriota bacterium]
ASSGSTIAVQRVSESVLKDGKSADPVQSKDSAADAKTQSDSTQKVKTDSKDGTKTATAPKKKKGPLHVFKSLYPF